MSLTEERKHFLVLMLVCEFSSLFLEMKPLNEACAKSLIGCLFDVLKRFNDEVSFDMLYSNLDIAMQESLDAD